MSPGAIQLRPMGATLSRRVAVVLATTFAAVLGLAWLACRSLSVPPAAAPGVPSASRAAVAQPVTMLPPAGVVSFHVPASADPTVPATPLTAPVRSLLGEWSALLRAHPDARVVLTLASGDDTSPLQQRRVGASVVRELVGSDLNAHRVQLVLTSAGAFALSPGDFRLTLEMGRP